jgi:hypothetical protein
MAARERRHPTPLAGKSSTPRGPTPMTEDCVLPLADVRTSRNVPVQSQGRALDSRRLTPQVLSITLARYGFSLIS